MESYIACICNQNVAVVMYLHIYNMEHTSVPITIVIYLWWTVASIIKWQDNNKFSTLNHF